MTSVMLVSTSSGGFVGTAEPKPFGTPPSGGAKPSPSAEKDHLIPAGDADKDHLPRTPQTRDRPSDSSVTPADSSDKDRSTDRSRLSRILEVVTAVIALGAFLLSVYNWIEANQTPQLNVAMPKLVRLTQHSDGYTLAIQPTFAVIKKSDATNVVSSVRLEVESKGDVSPHFRWIDVVRYIDSDSQTHVPRWQYLADPAPIVVTLDRPRNDHLRFASAQPLPAGTWTMRLIVERVGQKPLEQSFCLSLTKIDVQSMRDHVGSYYVFRNDWKIDELGAGDCYSTGATS
jgi:hypothetical protein